MSEHIVAQQQIPDFRILVLIAAADAPAYLDQTRCGCSLSKAFAKREIHPSFNTTCSHQRPVLDTIAQPPLHALDDQVPMSGSQRGGKVQYIMSGFTHGLGNHGGG